MEAKSVESFTVKMYSLESLESTEDGKTYLKVGPQATAYLTNWVKCCGVEYYVGLFVRTGTEENSLIFSQNSLNHFAQ